MAGWKEQFKREWIRSPETVIHEFKPFEKLAGVVEEIQQLVANEYEGDGDDYINVEVSVRNNKLRIKVELENPPVSLPAGGEQGMVLTRGSGSVEDEGGAYWDWVRAVEL